MKLGFGMAWVRFNHGESGFFTADRTRVLEAVFLTRLVGRVDDGFAFRVDEGTGGQAIMTIGKIHGFGLTGSFTVHLTKKVQNSTSFTYLVVEPFS